MSKRTVEQAVRDEITAAIEARDQAAKRRDAAQARVAAATATWEKTVEALRATLARISRAHNALAMLTANKEEAVDEPSPATGAVAREEVLEPDGDAT